jgi:hypothetical protein
VNGLVKKMPALLTSTSIDLKRDNAVSTILAAVAGSPMWASARATCLEAAISVDWVIFRELATTLKPRSTKAFTIPAPIPYEAPVTMVVFGGRLMLFTSRFVRLHLNASRGGECLTSINSRFLLAVLELERRLRGAPPP